MKSIVTVEHQDIYKNNKRHCLYYLGHERYSDDDFYIQENYVHCKKKQDYFQHKYHNYYERSDKYYSFNNQAVILRQILLD
jgi:hypothetical protein